MKIELAKTGVICLLDKIPKPYLIIGQDIFDKENDIMLIDNSCPHTRDFSRELGHA